MAPAGATAVVMRAGARVQMWLPFHDRIAVFISKSIRDFSGKIDPRFSFSDSDDDRD
jgi:hypothetical protein